MANFLGTPRVQYFESGTAEFLTGGKLYSYEAGTLTPTVTYPTIADADAGTNPNTNPVILDARGEAAVVIAGATKLILKDADDNIIWTEDDIGVSAATGNIVDTAGNTLLGFVSIVNSVNYWQITNASTGTAPVFSAVGGDLNVEGKITSKGTSSLKLDGGVSGTLELNGTSTGDVNIKRNTDITGTLATSDDVTITGTMNSTDISTGAITSTDLITTTGTVNADTSVTATAATISDSLAVAGNTDFLPTGSFIWYAGTSAPTGWLQCDGSAVSRTEYSDLFAVIATTFGIGDGTTTFNLPDMRRHTAVGSGGTGTSELGNAVGNSGGAETHTLIEDELPSHSHASQQDSPAISAANGGFFNAVQSNLGSTGTAGSDDPHNNLQPSLVLFAIIRAV